MMHRRDLFIGGACLAAAAAGWGFRPRRHVSLLGSAKMADIVPMSAGEWSGQNVSDLVATDTPDSLSARLYQELIERVYVSASSGAQVMMLLAHGNTQSEQLQLHRPERCYPAFGFAISDDHETELPLGAGVSIPARSLVANGAGHQEAIIYWARIGEKLPTSPREQQVARVEAAMNGYVADGVLARFSAVGPDTTASLATLRKFVSQLLYAVTPDKRQVLIGSSRAAAIASVRV